MTSIDKYDHAKFIIGRYDLYLNIVNSKSAFYIGLNTFLLSGLLTGYTSIYSQLHKPQYLIVLLVLFAVSSLFSIGLTILAINPYLKSGNDLSKDRSFLFFGSVAHYDKGNFITAYSQQDGERMLHDTVSQTWMLSKGLVSKYKKLKLAGYLLIFQFVLLIPIIYFITINLISK